MHPPWTSLHTSRSFATVTGFSLIWEIWGLAALGAGGAIIVFVMFAWREGTEYVVSAAEVERIDRAHRQVVPVASGVV